MSARDYLDKDFYAVLGVTKTATADEIKKAYRKLARQVPPRRQRGDEKAEEKFKEISEAYDVLSDDDQASRVRRDAHSTAARSPARASPVAAASAQVAAPTSTSATSSATVASVTCSAGCSVAAGLVDASVDAVPPRATTSPPASLSAFATPRTA